MVNEYPSDEVLLERGKYSTLASRRRALLKQLRDDMEALANYARLVLRAPDDLAFALSQIINAGVRLSAAKKHMAALAELEPAITKLKPLAWPNDKEAE